MGGSAVRVRALLLAGGGKLLVIMLHDGLFSVSQRGGRRQNQAGRAGESGASA